MATSLEQYLARDISTIPDSEANRGKLTRFIFDDTLHKEVQDYLFFTKMMGLAGPDQGGENPQDGPKVAPAILDKTQLGKGRGAHIEMPMLKKLTGSYAYGKTTVVDTSYEEPFGFAYVKVYIETMRHATGYIGDMSEVRNKFLNEENARTQLAEWLAKQEEQSVFDAFYRGWSQHVIDGLPDFATSTAHPNWYYGGDASSEETLDSEDTFDAAEILKMSTYAQMSKWNKVRAPNGVGGMEEGFIMLIHPFQSYDLKTDPVWTQAQREANVRDWKNPIFSGALGMYDGVFLYTSTLVEIAAAGVTDRTKKRRAIFFGAHAVARATGIPERVTRRKEDDYENIRGWCISKTFGYRRLDWIDDDATADSFNQSSAILTTWAAQPY